MTKPEGIERHLDTARVYAEELRDTLTLSLKGSDQEWRSVDIQVAFVTNIIARAIQDAVMQEREECAKIAEDEDGHFTLCGIDKNTAFAQSIALAASQAIRNRG